MIAFRFMPDTASEGGLTPRLWQVVDIRTHQPVQQPDEAIRLIRFTIEYWLN